MCYRPDNQGETLSSFDASYWLALIVLSTDLQQIYLMANWSKFLEDKALQCYVRFSSALQQFAEEASKNTVYKEMNQHRVST